MLTNCSLVAERSKLVQIIVHEQVNATENCSRASFPNKQHW